MKKKTAALLALTGLTGFAGLSFVISERLFKLAFQRVDYVPETSDDKKKYAHRYWDYMDWFKHSPKQQWTLSNTDEEGRMSAYYIPAADAESKKTVMIFHGYKGNGPTMSGYAKMFHDMGFNVLLPDERAHGASAGKYINFGWLDRLDALRWINELIKKQGQDTKILLFGVSMGGATVEMLSGKKLPAQVKCLIADCGYSDIEEEMTYLLKQQFHWPQYPVYPLVSTITRHRLGFYLGDVSSKKQLEKNKLPIMFIHGEKDVLVPTNMAYENFRATKAPKELWIVDGATHAESFWKDSADYQRHIQKFLQKYFY